MRSLLPLTCAAFMATAAPGHAAGLRDGFQSALALNAELRTLEAQQDVVAARRGRADSLLPGAPVAMGGVRSDAMFQDNGYLQLEAGIAAPLWLPGESRALRNAAETSRLSLAARIARQRLTVAGEVRDAYWAWAVVAAELDAQRSRVEQARALAATLERQERAGNVPRTDLLVAIAALREAEGTLRERQQAARDAAIAFRALTGLTPTAGSTEAPANVRPSPNDPRLAAARAATEDAQSAERVARIRDRANPELGVQIRTQRDTRGESFSPNILLTGRLPLRHGPTHREAMAEARAATIAAEAEAGSAERVLLGSLDRAREARRAALDLARLSEDRHRALAEQASLYETSWRGGQLPLIELVRVRSQLAEADVARRRSRAEAGRAASEINQMLGLEPR